VHRCCAFGCADVSSLQGFFGPSTPEQQGNNPYGGSEGTDFRRNHDIDTIDFTVAHSACRGTAFGCCTV
jgi:hypothetical protein